MEENEYVTNDYLKAFNQGYVLNQHQPELATTLGKVLGESERSNAFKDGIAE